MSDWLVDFFVFVCLKIIVNDVYCTDGKHVYMIPKWVFDTYLHNYACLA